MMKKRIFTIFVASILVGCGGDKPKETTVDAVEADVSQIKVTQGEKRVEQVEAKHEEELKKDKKGFYYAYDDKDAEANATDETFTRRDAEVKVKNRVVDGKVAVREKNHKASTPYQYVRIDLLKNALSHEFMVKCSACHDDYANGVIGPSLLEKDGDYIYEQMLKYRNDPKKNILMYELVNKMTEDEMKTLSNEVAQFNKEIRALKGSK
jgi:cytochrome c553